MQSNFHDTVHYETFRRLLSVLSSYWFVAIPAIVLNGLITIDFALAQHNEQVYSVTINSEILTALGVPQDDKTLSETLHSHWIVADEEGNVAGRISAIEPNETEIVPIEQLDVTLLQHGEKIRKAITQEDGRFTLENVEPGIYTLVASGQNGFLAYGVQVLPPIAEFDFPAGALKGSDSKDSWHEKQAYYVAYFGLPRGTVIDEELKIDAAVVPPEFSALENISSRFFSAAHAMSVDRDQDDRKGIAQAPVIRGGYKFPLTAAGDFNGRVQPISTKTGELAVMSGMNLFLIQDDVEIRRTPIQENGKFVVPNVEPGVYSLIAAGEDGFAALSVQLTESGVVEAPVIGDVEELGSAEASGGHYVSIQADNVPANPSLGIAIVTDPADLRFIRDEIIRLVALRQVPLPGDQFANPRFEQPVANPTEYVSNIEFAPTQAYAPGEGFSPGAGYAPVGASSGPSYYGGGAYGSGLGGGTFRSGRGRLFPLLAMIPGIIALAENDSSPSDPLPTSPNTSVSTSTQ